MYPYNNSNAMIVAEVVEDLLGDSLLSLQLGNEPDLYAGHGRRPSNYSLEDYFTEFESYLTDFNATSVPEKKIILGPRSVRRSASACVKEGSRRTATVIVTEHCFVLFPLGV